MRELIELAEPILYSAHEPGGEEEVRRAEELRRVVAG